MRRLPILLALVGVLAFPQPAASRGTADSVYAKDVAFALAQLDKECGHFFELKGIDWKAVAAEFSKEAKKVKSDEEHLRLLTRLLARLEDGHASVRPGRKGQDVHPADDGSGGWKGPGLFLCRSGKSILVKNSWSGAGASGVTPGMEVIALGDLPAAKWLEKKIAEMRDTRGYSTDEQAFYAACHWGLAGPPGSTLPIELRGVDGKPKKVTITRGKASVIPEGPAFPPADLQTIGRQRYGKSKGGFGYIHLRDIPGEIPEQMDTMLAAIGNVPGLVLDFRANGGGGCDHEALIGRFVPAGKSLPVGKRGGVKSAGATPYGGPIVAIVDAGVRSAGETVSGMIKEYGRAYVIGESATAGMSSSKKTIELPSGLFVLYVSVSSNMDSFNDGRGIEGIGIPPHEIVPFAAKDLAAGVDTLIAVAEERLRDFPQSKVAYKPADYGWKLR